jgi:hypothetical protein
VPAKKASMAGFGSRRNVGDDVAERLQTLAFGDSGYLIEYELDPSFVGSDRMVICDEPHLRPLPRLLTKSLANTWRGEDSKSTHSVDGQPCRRAISCVRFWLLRRSPEGNSTNRFGQLSTEIKSTPSEGIEPLRCSLPRQTCNLLKPVLFFHALLPLPDSSQLD